MKKPFSVEEVLIRWFKHRYNDEINWKHDRGHAIREIETYHNYVLSEKEEELKELKELKQDLKKAEERERV